MSGLALAGLTAVAAFAGGVAAAPVVGSDDHDDLATATLACKDSRARQLDILSPDKSSLKDPSQPLTLRCTWRKP
jgi:hypothetical protein